LDPTVGFFTHDIMEPFISIWKQAISRSLGLRDKLSLCIYLLDIHFYFAQSMGWAAQNSKD